MTGKWHAEQIPVKGVLTVTLDYVTVAVISSIPGLVVRESLNRVETQDLSRKYPEKVKEMEILYQSWAERVGIPDQLENKN